MLVFVGGEERKRYWCWGSGNAHSSGGSGGIDGLVSGVMEGRGPLKSLQVLQAK